MQPVAQMPYDEREQTTTKWVMLFVILSLLAHVLVFLAIYVLSLVVPAPKLETPPAPPPEVTLSLQPAPVAPPPQPHIFMPTPEQPNAPHRETQVESDHDTQLASQSKKERAESIMPDVKSPAKHASQLKNSPNSPTKPQQQAAPTPPTPKTEQPKQQPQPTPPQPKPPQPQPPKPSPPQETKNQVDPTTGLPVLPPLSAPTIEPQSTQPKAAAPPRSDPSFAANMEGRAGMSGEPTPDSTATELGRYKAKVYLAVASHWYPKINDAMQILPVGVVKIQYTIHSDGTIDNIKVLEGDNNTLEVLKDLSLLSMKEPAPFDPFTPAMIKQVGDSYTDFFSFSVYGQ